MGARDPRRRILPSDRLPPDTAERPGAVTRSARTALSTYEDGDPVDVGLTCKGVTLPVRDQDFDCGWGSSHYSIVRDIKRGSQGGRIYDHLAGGDVGREVPVKVTSAIPPPHEDALAPVALFPPKARMVQLELSIAA